VNGIRYPTSSGGELWLNVVWNFGEYNMKTKKQFGGTYKVEYVLAAAAIIAAIVAASANLETNVNTANATVSTNFTNELASIDAGSTTITGGGDVVCHYTLEAIQDAVLGSTYTYDLGASYAQALTNSNCDSEDLAISMLLADGQFNLASGSCESVTGDYIEIDLSGALYYTTEIFNYVTFEEWNNLTWSEPYLDGNELLVHVMIENTLNLRVQIFDIFYVPMFTSAYIDTSNISKVCLTW